MLNFRSSVAALLAATKLAAADGPDGPAGSTTQALDCAALSVSSPSTLSVGDRLAGAAPAAADFSLTGLPTGYRNPTAANLDAAGGENRVGARQTGAGSETSRRDIIRGLYWVNLDLGSTLARLEGLSDLLTRAQGASKDPDRGAHRILEEALQETLEIKGEMQGIDDKFQETSTKVEWLLSYHVISADLRKFTTLAAAALSAAVGWLAKSWFSSRESS